MNPAVPWGQAWRFWLKLGFISFGGPAGQIALMHAEIVQRQRWVSEQRFLHALNYCMVLPGPEAQQLATYLGWLMHRTWGGIAAGALFVLPSLLLMMLLSGLYLLWGDNSLLRGALYGIKPDLTALGKVPVGTRSYKMIWVAMLHSTPARPCKTSKHMATQTSRLSVTKRQAQPKEQAMNMASPTCISRRGSKRSARAPAGREKSK